MQGSGLETAEASATDWPRVGIIVLTWENHDEAAECLASLESVTYPNFEVIVVDNGSADGSAERLQREFDQYHFIINEENLGFARGNNVGIDYALSQGMDYVLLLNDDTVVTDGFLTPLVETAESREHVAAVGGINLRATTGAVHNAGTRFLPFLGGRTYLYKSAPTDRPYPTDYVPSCLVLLSKEFIRQHDVLNEDYFIGMEDVDLAWQARKHGWQVLINPEAEILHRIGSTSEFSAFSAYHKTRNRLQFAKDHLSPLERLLLYVTYGAWLLTLYPRWLYRREEHKIVATLLGVVDHVTGVEPRPYEELA